MEKSYPWNNYLCRILIFWAIVSFGQSPEKELLTKCIQDKNVDDCYRFVEQFPNSVYLYRINNIILADAFRDDTTERLQKVIQKINDNNSKQIAYDRIEYVTFLRALDKITNRDFSREKFPTTYDKAWKTLEEKYVSKYKEKGGSYYILTRMYVNWYEYMPMDEFEERIYFHILYDKIMEDCLKEYGYETCVFNYYENINYRVHKRSYALIEQHLRIIFENIRNPQKQQAILRRTYREFEKKHEISFVDVYLEFCSDDPNLAMVRDSRLSGLISSIKAANLKYSAGSTIDEILTEDRVQQNQLISCLFYLFPNYSNERTYKSKMEFNNLIINHDDLQSAKQFIDKYWINHETAIILSLLLQTPIDDPEFKVKYEYASNYLRENFFDSEIFRNALKSRMMENEYDYLLSILPMNKKSISTPFNVNFILNSSIPFFDKELPNSELIFLALPEFNIQIRDLLSSYGVENISEIPQKYLAFLDIDYHISQTLHQNSYGLDARLKLINLETLTVDAMGKYDSSSGWGEFNDRSYTTSEIINELLTDLFTKEAVDKTNNFLSQRQSIQEITVDKNEANRWMNRIGISIKDIDTKSNDENVIQGGILVVEVNDLSPADGAFIQKGDIIYQIEKQQISNIQDYEKIIKTFKSGEIGLFRLLRHSNTIVAFVKIP